MNVVIDGQGEVPEPLASIYSAMAGDGAAVFRAARMLWGDEAVVEDSEGLTARGIRCRVRPAAARTKTKT